MTEQRMAPRKKGKKMGAWIAGGLAVLVVLAALGPALFYRAITGPDAPHLALPTTGPHTTIDVGDGTWTIADALASYRATERYLWASHEYAGVTDDVVGQVTVEGDRITAVDATVRLADVRVDGVPQSGFAGVLDLADYPEASFVLRAPITLDGDLGNGEQVNGQAEGDLTLHGQTHPVTFAVQARATGDGVTALGSAEIDVTRWGVEPPSFLAVARLDPTVTIEFLLTLLEG